MTTIIWFEQLVTYPQFLDIVEAEFRDHYKGYCCTPSNPGFRQRSNIKVEKQFPSSQSRSAASSF